MNTNPADPFAALAALRDTLPEGEDPKAEPVPTTPKLPKLAIHFERKGRGGKEATIITGFDTEQQAAETGATLRRQLGTGGSARGCEALLQGDRREAARNALQALGFKI